MIVIDVLLIQFLVGLFFVVHDIAVLGTKPGKSWIRFVVAVILVILSYVGFTLIRG